MNYSSFTCKNTFGAVLLSATLLLCTDLKIARAQSTQPQTATQTQSDGNPQLKPLSLPQLYWAFLSYQDRLDTLAAQLEAKGKDASWVRNDLQTKLGFSDADYVPIRAASQHFTSTLTVLSRQMKQLQSTGSMHDPAHAQALTALNSQRKADLDNEIYNLSQELSPQNRKALEAFMKQFFAPKTISFRTPAATGSSDGKGAQK